MKADHKFGEELDVMDQKKSEDTGLNRREFIKGAVAGSAVLATRAASNAGGREGVPFVASLSRS